MTTGQAIKMAQQTDRASYSRMKQFGLGLGVVLLGLLVQKLWRVPSEGYQHSILSDLGSGLSSNASIILPSSVHFENATRRWVEYEGPSFGAVVVVATEEDVQKTVLYANAHGIPFLATSGKHGAISSLQELRNGIQIEMGQLNTVQVSRTGEYATIGGGAKGRHTMRSLAAQGKRTVTGVCECVGIGGVMLGGGHGFLQGEYGLMADQIIDARLVLANGTAVTVSATSHPDLFWAIRGAGHNFGIVTEVNFKVYEAAGHEEWSYESFLFDGAQLEDVIHTINDLRATQSAETVHLGYVLRIPDVDPNNAVINWVALHDGDLATLSAHTAPLRALQPLVYEAARTPYDGMANFYGSGIDQPACQPGMTMQRFGIRLEKYDTGAFRKIYTLFNDKMKDTPALNGSVLALESYPTQGVQAVQSETMAFPFREDDILFSPFLYYAPNATLDHEVRELGERIRRIAHEGTCREEVKTYINYDHGSESLEQIYGHEPWRLQKLRQLKAQYDPEGRFNFYAPIS